MLLEPEERQRTIAMVCSDPPAGRSRWTVRLVAEEAVKRRLVPKVGRETIRLLLHDDLKPWRKKMWNVPELTEQYVARMDVLETYERALDPAEPVVCLDEKPVTLHAEVRPATQAEPGREARRDSEYERRGTANVFCAVDPLAGRHFTFATPNRSGLEFAIVAAKLALAYPSSSTIHLVTDNLNIHRRKSLTDTFGKEIGTEIWNRFTAHYTPKPHLVHRNTTESVQKDNRSILSVLEESSVRPSEKMPPQNYQEPYGTGCTGNIDRQYRRFLIDKPRFASLIVCQRQKAVLRPC